MPPRKIDDDERNRRHHQKLKKEKVQNAFRPDQIHELAPYKIFGQQRLTRINLLPRVECLNVPKREIASRHISGL